MGRLLKQVKDVENLRRAIKQCKHDVYLRSVDGKEEFDMKSTLSEYIALGRLCDEGGDQYELFCSHEDEGILLEFFYELDK